MRIVKTLIVTIGTIALASPVFAGTPTLAGAPSHAPTYKMENGVKVFRVLATAETSIENGVKVHRLMQAPSYYSGQNGHTARSAFDNQIKIIKKRAKKQKKKAFKKGYDEGYHDGYQTAIENERSRYRRPIRLRQRIRTRPRVSRDVLRRRNLQ